jgi:hypothetical protein
MIEVVVRSIYADPGRKCPNCPCLFSSEVDFLLHKKACAERREERMGWRESSVGDGSKICPSDRDPELVQAIRRNGGSVNLGRYAVDLSKNGKWLIRREVMFR